jgi:hypothetical protein
MSIDEVKHWLEEIRENWDDPYWRVDHPEVMAVLVAIITGVIGLAFAVLQALIQRRLIDA